MRRHLPRVFVMYGISGRRPSFGSAARKQDDLEAEVREQVVRLNGLHEGEKAEDCGNKIARRAMKGFDLLMVVNDLGLLLTCKSSTSNLSGGPMTSPLSRSDRRTK